VKRAVTDGTRAYTGNIEERVNLTESIQTGDHGTSHGKFVTDIGASKICLGKLGHKSVAFRGIDADYKYRIFCTPQPCCRGRDSR
jgi:hypothetical protein